MGFRLVQKSVTLSELERRNDRYLAFFSPNSATLRPDYGRALDLSTSLSLHCDFSNSDVQLAMCSCYCELCYLRRYLSCHMYISHVLLFDVIKDSDNVFVKMLSKAANPGINFSWGSNYLLFRNHSTLAPGYTAVRG